MLRYFAAFWTDEDPMASDVVAAAQRRLQANDRSWSTAFDIPGTRVLTLADTRGPDRPVRVGDERGVVLGTLFNRSFDGHVCARVDSLSDERSEEVSRTQGRALVEGCWGRYIALLSGPGRELFVLRDPTGAMPCYFASVGAVTFIFSHLPDYLLAHQHRPSINWRHIGAHLHFSRVVSHETGLDGVEQVRAGERLRLRAGSHDTERSFLWHPVRVYQSGTIEQPSVALDVLRDTVRSSVRTWASCYPNILHELSGGLDSAIVLACLTNPARHADIVCFNMYTESSDGDERAYAHQAARHARCEIVEAPFRPEAKSLQQMLRVEGLASPTLSLLKSEAEDLRAHHSRQRNVTAIFSGQGGDNLLQRRKDDAIPVEYLRRHGLGRGLPRIIEDTARLTGKTVWSVARRSITSVLTRGSFDPYAVCKSPSFWNAQRPAAEFTGPMRHSWVADAAELPPCKTQQVFDVIDAQMFYAQQCDYADVVHPLISQPLIECVLQIPSYVLTTGGRERALARTAFAGVVPSDILARTSKGAATSYFQKLLLTNADFIRDTLMSGELVREGMLDRSNLELALSYGALLRGAELGSILTALMSERWLASWRDYKH